MKLNEFAIGKADSVSLKIFNILSRRTKIKFAVQQSLIPYHNRWGKFVGRFAVTPDKKCFRLNFSRSGSDEAVSLEYWAKGKNPYKTPPNSVLSFEGWGITKIFFQVEAFVKGNFNVDESIDELAGCNLDEAYFLHEATVKELFGLYAEDNPSVVADIVKGGFNEADMFAKLKNYIGVKNVKVLGFSTDTLASAIRSYLKKAAKGEIPSSIPPTQAAQAAKAVPVAEVVPGTAEGVNTVDVDLYDILNPALASQVNGYISELNNEEIGAFGVIRRFERQLKVAAARNVGARLVVACGRAGTGKTFTVKRYLQYGDGMGLSPGAGYIEAQGIKFDNEDDVTGLFCLNKDIPIILFDDADQLFISRSVGVQNIMKHVLDPDRANRVLSVPKDVTTKAGKVPAGDYTIDCKLIWCTNLGPENLNAAVADRMMKPANVFNFTDQEILDMVKASLNDAYDEFPGLSHDEILNVFMFFQDVVNHLAKDKGYNFMNEGVSFRNFKNTLTQMETYKLLGLPLGEVWKELSAAFKIQIRKPNQVVTGG
jgi:hypothetical protein